jgi:two-component sensor histidine kinase
LERSLQASKSLVFVVNDLLYLTEAEKASFEVREENVDLRSMLSEVVATFRDEASRRNLHISIEDDLIVPERIRCDPIGLQQVVSNLLANGLQSSETGRIIVSLRHIEATEASSTIQISVKDEGIGLSEHQLDSIFQDFEQILDENEGSASDEQGAKEHQSKPVQIGLGLATAARFVRIHSGQISMSSEGEGEGTSVSITIPFRKALSGDFARRRTSPRIALPTPPSDTLSSSGLETPSSETPSSSSPITTPMSANPTRSLSLESSQGRFPFPTTNVRGEQITFNVLIAEDNPLNSRLLETRLKRRGHTVQVAVDGKACVDAFKNNSQGFDVILMDIQVSLPSAAFAQANIHLPPCLC